MANDSGPFRSYGRPRAEDMRKRYQDRMKTYRSLADNNMSAAPWMMSRLTEHVADAFLFVNRVRQAQDLHGMLRVHAAFVQKKIDMFAGGANVLKDVLATAGTVGGFSSVGQLRKRAEELARNSPKYASDDHDRKDGQRAWRARF